MYDVAFLLLGILHIFLFIRCDDPKTGIGLTVHPHELCPVISDSDIAYLIREFPLVAVFIDIHFLTVYFV